MDCCSCRIFLAVGQRGRGSGGGGGRWSGKSWKARSWNRRAGLHFTCRYKIHPQHSERPTHKKSDRWLFFLAYLFCGIYCSFAVYDRFGDRVTKETARFEDMKPWYQGITLIPLTVIILNTYMSGYNIITTLRTCYSYHNSKTATDCCCCRCRFGTVLQ